MLASAILVLAAGLFGLSTAQNSTAGPTVTTTATSSAYPYTVAAGSVPSATAAAWCMSQMNSCIAVCGGVAYPNSCNPDTLTYDCQCTYGPTPDLAQYNGTLLFEECQQYVANCVAATDNAQAQKQCLAIQCGGKSPQAALSASQAAASGSMPASSGSMVTTTTTAASSATAAATSASSSHNAAVADVEARRAYSTGALVAGVFALVGFVL